MDRNLKKWYKSLVHHFVWTYGISLWQLQRPIGFDLPFEDDDIVVGVSGGRTGLEGCCGQPKSNCRMLTHA